MDGTIRIRSVAWFATAVVLTLVCSLLVTQAWSVGAAPGDSDSTFVPTAGCRLVDTRPAPFTVGPRNTPLVANDTMEVTVHGTNGQCTGALAIPTDAVGVALNVTAVNATTSSNIRVFPADLTTVPLLSNLNVFAGAPPTPNKVDVKLSPDGKVKVYNFKGSVDVILDVVGYYTDSSLKELDTRLAALEADVYTKTEVDTLLAGKLDDAKVLWAIVNGDGTLDQGKGAVSSSRVALGTYNVEFNRDMSTCAATGTPADANSDGVVGAREVTLNQLLGDPTSFFVQARNSGGTEVDSSFTVVAVCP